MNPAAAGVDARAAASAGRAHRRRVRTLGAGIECPATARSAGGRDASSRCGRRIRAIVVRPTSPAIERAAAIAIGSNQAAPNERRDRAPIHDHPGIAFSPA
ncbi:MAG: hypothetical protein JF591_08510 [Lysobacter sp.]|nr:hypothetical protein [Lysobacter sp.]